MELSSYRIALIPITLLSIVATNFGSCSPMPDSELSARQRVDCFDTATTFSESCWQILDLRSYLNHPVTGWNKTVPICTGWDLDSTCCIADEPWTTCYLRLAHGKSGADCSQINAQACSYDPSLNVDPSIAPYVAYTMKNIYGTYAEWCHTKSPADSFTYSHQQSLHDMVPCAPICLDTSALNCSGCNPSHRPRIADQLHSKRPSLRSHMRISLHSSSIRRRALRHPVGHRSIRQRPA